MMLQKKVRMNKFVGVIIWINMIIIPQVVLAEVRADVNLDNDITTVDAVLTLKKALGLNMSDTDWQISPTTGDVDCNNETTVTDAMLILKNSLGLDIVGSNYCGSFNSYIKESFLQEQYNNGEYYWADKNGSAYYQEDTEGMVFEVTDNSRIRCELRTFLDNEWPLTTVFKKISGKVKISDIGQDVDTFTFLQLHHKDGEHYPFVRIAWQKSDNLLKAVVRNDEGDGGHNNYFFGTLPEGTFFPVEITVNRDSLHISVNNELVDVPVPDYWKTQERFYYKAGVYFGISSTFYKKARVEYKMLNVYGDF